MSDTNYFAVTLIRGLAGRPQSQRATLAGLGLRRLGKTVYLKDTPAVRGMLYKVVHLVTVAPQHGTPPRLSARARARASA